MSAFPQTPRHSPHPSLEFQSPSYSPQERRQSKSSYHEPSTPLRNTFASSDGMDMGLFSSGGGALGGGAGGLGNLADELAGAFSDGEEDDDYYRNEEGTPDISFDLEEDGQEQAKEAVRDSGVDVESPPSLALRQARGSLSLPSPAARGHRRSLSEYDGSEYGSETDLHSPGMPPKLVEKIDEVESLARRGTETSPMDGALKQVTEGLRDLGSQAGVEGGASRYVISPFII